MMKTSDTGLALIQEFEGLRLKAYYDAVGVPTIGYGHTKTVTAEMVESGHTISRTEALRLLIADLTDAERAVNRLVAQPLSQWQFDAFVSLTFNIGVGALQRSTARRLHNNAAPATEVAAAFRLWNRAGGKVLPGLVRRRDAEAELYLRQTPPQPPRNTHSTPSRSATPSAPKDAA